MITMFSKKNNSMSTLSAEISEAMKNIPAEECEVTPSVRQYAVATVVVVGQDVRNVTVSASKAVVGASKRVVRFPVNVTRATKDLAAEVRTAHEVKAAWKQHEAK